MRLKTIASLLALLSVGLGLSGCSQLAAKKYSEEATATVPRTQDRYAQEWTDPSVIKEGTAQLVLITPMAPPKSVTSKHVRLELEDGATIRDLTAVLGNLGYSIILADNDVGTKTFFLPKYQGNLGNLLSAVSRAADVWFTWHDGVLVVSSKEKVALTLPQEKALGEKVKAGLTELGISDGQASWEAGMVSFEVKPSQLQRARHFLERMSKNAALVSLQVALVSVTLNQDTKQGIDWTKLQLAIGGDHINLLNTLNAAGTGVAGAVGATTTTTTTGTGATTGTTTTTTTGSPTTYGTGGTDPGKGFLYTAGGLRTAVTSAGFTLIGMMNFLDTYGEAETRQSVLLKTVTGSEVELKSVTQIPYVSGVSVATTGSTVSNNSALLGGVSTATADDGITLKMKPAYDAASNSVTVDMNLSVQAVLGFNNLSAGNQVGNMTQPTRATRSFNDVLRMRPGQTMVVGGITYDSITRNGNLPLFLPNGMDYKGLVVNRQTMFIVIRPTVSVLGSLEEQQGKTELFPMGNEIVDPEEKPAMKAVPHAGAAADLPADSAKPVKAKKSAKKGA